MTPTPSSEILLYGRFLVLREAGVSVLGPRWLCVDRDTGAPVHVTLARLPLRCALELDALRRRLLEVPRIIPIAPALELLRVSRQVALVGAAPCARSLPEVLAEGGRLSRDRAGRLREDLSLALAAIHAAGLVHGGIQVSAVAVSGALGATERFRLVGTGEVEVAACLGDADAERRVATGRHGDHRAINALLTEASTSPLTPSCASTSETGAKAK